MNMLQQISNKSTLLNASKQLGQPDPCVCCTYTLWFKLLADAPNRTTYGSKPEHAHVIYPCTDAISLVLLVHCDGERRHLLHIAVHRCVRPGRLAHTDLRCAAARGELAKRSSGAFIGARRHLGDAGHRHRFWARHMNTDTQQYKIAFIHRQP